MSLDTDLDFMLAGPLGNVLVSGFQTTRCFLDQQDVLQTDTAGGQVNVRSTVARYRTGSITLPVSDATVTVDGTTYYVRDSNLEGDGKVTVLVLAGAA